MVPIEYAELGTKFNVDVRGETTTATVVRDPFIDPNRETPKG